jgi:hypothetical protein
MLSWALNSLVHLGLVVSKYCMLSTRTITMNTGQPVGLAEQKNQRVLNDLIYRGSGFLAGV